MWSPSDSPSEDRSLPARDSSARLTERALRESVGLPLTAMRVTVESLADRLPRGSEEARVARSLLESVARVTADVETIMESLSSPTPRALRCTIDELLRSTRARLGARASALEVACSCAPDTVLVDGPLLVRLLTRLLSAAAEDSAEPVLLSVRETSDDLLFAIVHSGTRGERVSGGAIRRIEQSLAHQEAVLLGADLGTREGVGGQVVTMLALPRAAANHGGLAA